MVNFAKTEAAIRKLFGIFSNKNTTIRCLSKNTICTSEAVMPRSVIKPVKALSTDVVEIQPNRLSLKTKLREGNLSNLGVKINIPKGRLNAPRAGFDESLKAYTNIIRDNKGELQNLCSKYQQGMLNEEQFANKYAEFLAEKIDMPYYPELKKIISDTTAGGYQHTTNTLYYNLSGMSRMSDLMQTINHEMHHFLQQKEIFSTMSIEKFSGLKAKADIMELLRKNPNLYKTKAEIEKAIESQTKGYIKDFKDAGWDKILEKYPKNSNPDSPYYKRAQKLIEADLNYTDGTENISAYMSNIIEREAYEIGVYSQLEIEHSVLNTISKKEKDIALEIYNCLKDPSFAEIDGVSDILQSFNRNPYNLVEIVKEANSMGLNDPYSIIQRIL